MFRKVITTLALTLALSACLEQCSTTKKFNCAPCQDTCEELCTPLASVYTCDNSCSCMCIYDDAGIDASVVVENDGGQPDADYYCSHYDVGC